MAGRRLDPKAYLLFTILLFTLYLVRYHLIPAHDPLVRYHSLPTAVKKNLRVKCT